MARRSIEEVLRSLTVKEAKILYWKCRGLTYEQIGQHVIYSASSVQLYMSKVYAKLGITDPKMHGTERKKILEKEFCPALEKLIKDPNTDFEKLFLPDEPGEPQPDLGGLVLVNQDLLVSPSGQIVPPPPSVPRSPLWLVVLGVVVISAAAGIVLRLLGIDLPIPFIDAPTATVEQVAASSNGNVPVGPTATDALEQEPTATFEPVVAPTLTPTSVGVGGAAASTSTPVPPTPTYTTTPTPAPTNTPPETNILFEDTFDSRARPEWVASSGTWRVVNDAYTTDEINSDVVVELLGESWTNYSIEFDIYHCGDETWIMVRKVGRTYMEARLTNWSSQWYLVADESKSKIGRDGGNVWSSAGSCRWRHARIEVKDDIYSIYDSDGDLALKVQDDTLTGGGIGIRYQGSEEVWIDNFKITRLD